MLRRVGWHFSCPTAPVCMNGPNGSTIMQQLSDKLRTGALEAIRAGGSDLEIMTRESMAAILGDMGLDVACELAESDAAVLISV